MKEAAWRDAAQRKRAVSTGHLMASTAMRSSGAKLPTMGRAMRIIERVGPRSERFWPEVREKLVHVARELETVVEKCHRESDPYALATARANTPIEDFLPVDIEERIDAMPLLWDESRSELDRMVLALLAWADSLPVTSEPARAEPGERASLLLEHVPAELFGALRCDDIGRKPDVVSAATCPDPSAESLSEEASRAGSAPVWPRRNGSS